MYHSFDVDIASKYGVLEAIILNNLWFWIEKNKANDKNYHDGKYWTYNSVNAFSKLFPYASARKISNALNKLISDGILVTANYNSSAYDRTLWYAFTIKGESIMQKCKMDSCETDESNIYNINKENSDSNNKLKNNPNKKHIVVEFSEEISQIISHLNNKASTAYRRETKKTCECISKILKAGYTVDDCKAVIDCKVQEWNGTEMQKYLRPSTLFADCHFEEYLQASKMKKPSSQNRQPNPKSSYDEYNDLNKFQRCEQEIERQIAAGERERAPWE